MGMKRQLKKAFVNCFSDRVTPGRNWAPFVLSFAGTLAGGAYVAQEAIEQDLSDKRVAVTGDKQLADLENRFSELTTFYAKARQEADILDKLRAKKDSLGKEYYKDKVFYESYAQQVDKLELIDQNFGRMKSGFIDRFYTYADIAETDASHLLERYTQTFGTGGKEVDLHHLAYLDECQDMQIKGELDPLPYAEKVKECAIIDSDSNKFTANFLGTLGGAAGGFALFFYFSHVARRKEPEMEHEDEENKRLAPDGEKVEKIQVKMVRRELPPPSNP